MKYIIIIGLIHIPKVKSKAIEKTDWIDTPIIIASAIHLISKYSHKEQNINDRANPTANINVVIMKYSEPIYITFIGKYVERKSVKGGMNKPKIQTNDKPNKMI